MKGMRIVVLALACTLGALAPTAQAEARGALGALRGTGFWAEAACGACVGSYAGASLMGYGALWSAITSVADGALMGACVRACAAAF